MNSNEPIIISAEEASESVFCFLGEFGYELISWLPYLLFLKGKRGIKLNTVSRIGSKVFYYFSDSHHEVEGRLIGDMWGEPEKYYHLQSVFNGKRIIHPGPDFINKKKIIIDGAEWENKDIHGIIKTNFYTSPDYSWVKTEYPFAIKKPFVVINNKFFRQWFQIYQAPLNYFDVKDIRLMVEMFKNYGYSVIYNHFIEETSIDQYFDFSFNDLKSDESFINLNDYYKNISNEERNKLQLSLFNDAEFVVGLQGGNMYLPALCKKNLWMLMRDGRYIDYLEFGRIYGIEVNVFYETWHLISAFKTYAENQNKYPVSTSNYIEKMQFAISGIKHPSTPIPPPFISICIPTYNRAEFIEEAIQSVLEQNYDNFEIVIVDDGSTDNTRQIVESIDSNKIRYYYKKHSGAPDTRNKCIKHSHGEFLLWLGDDDLLDKYALSSYYDYLKQYPSIDVIYGQLQSFGKSNYLYKYNDWWRKNDKMIEFLLIGSPIPDGGTLVRRSIYETLGYYDKHFNRAQDYEFWSRLALSEKFNCKYVPQITYKYRIHEKNITGELSKNTNYSYEIKILKNIISKAGVKKLFTQFDWNNSEIESFANAYTKISLRFFEWNSVDNALFYLLKSLDYGFSDEQEKILEVILKDLNVSKLYPELFKDLRDKHDYWVNEKNGSTITESVEVKRLGDLNNTVNEEKFVNICMVTYNRIEFTKQSIESVIKYPSYPYTLTVIDNNSEDGTKEYLEELKENGIIKNLILLEENVGVAKASNLAWSLEPEAEYYLKLDNDIVFEKVDWLKDMVNVVEAVSDAGAVAYNFEPISYPLSTINGIKVRVKKAGNLGGACILIPKRTMDILGYWNEEFGLYGEEDADYGVRISSTGLLNIYMYDENIGKHLPGGKAAAIDPQTLKSICSDENNYEKEYREWKDELRVNNVIGGKYCQVINEYITGERKLFCVSNFVKEYNNRKNNMSAIVSIIIPVYNKIELTKKCLIALYQNTTKNQKFEVIVIDNGSNDGTKEYLEEISKQKRNLTYLRNDENLGFAKANNIAAQYANTKYLLLLNNDTEAQPGWLESLIKMAENDPSIGAVGSKLLFTDNTIQHAGVLVYKKYKNKKEYQLIATHNHYKKMSDDPLVNIPYEYQVLTAACLLIPKTLYELLNGFDERFWNGYEDVDLCLRIREAGYKLVYCPDSTLIHYESQSGPERFSKVPENVELLQKLWLKKKDFDFIIKENNRLFATNTNAIIPYVKELTSIVIISFNNLEYLEETVNSIIDTVKVKYELIIIDNNSDESTKQYLNKLQDGAENIKIIFNNVNEGFPKAVNSAIKITTGSYFVILNNDIVLTHGWLERMITIAKMSNKIGMVGPVSNYVSGIQYLKDPKYKRENLDEFALKIKSDFWGKVQEFPRVAFLCTLIKREVIDKIGGLDERFSPGNFEDDDFCLRAQIAGYKTVIAKDVFIHHYGSKSFKADGEKKYLERLEINKKIFVDKWGADPEEIWLENKGIPKRNVLYPINQNLFTQSFERAMILLEDNDFGQALVELENSLDNFESIDRGMYPALMEIDVLNLLGNSAFQLGDYEKAHQSFEEELKLSPSSSRACAGLAETFLASGMLTEAKTMFEWALKYSPSDEKLFSRLIELNENLGLDRFNFSLYEEDNTTQKIHDSEDLINGGDFIEAEKILLEILSNSPANLDALNNLSAVYILNKNYKDAVAKLERVFAIDPANEIAAENLLHLNSILANNN